ncbi:DUF6881 domain-containing protein [Sphingobium cupriresistens]|uniref:DUF6881 domain-containing protein n=1 Tax=Sphingobium cupriresistens TaxID=1132417 RepID=UPI0009E6E848
MIAKYDYIRVRWLHSSQDEPVDLWSELNSNREEVRKIEIWHDGRIGYASQDREAGGTQLGVGALPTLAEIASNPEFEPMEISADDFERCWKNSVH